MKIDSEIPAAKSGGVWSLGQSIWNSYGSVLRWTSRLQLTVGRAPQ